ncbi:TonB-dependent receptor domain-containing protein [Hymenobacter jeollabukensis]|uniref:TonB-dependent receptor n=1 Tax=Hymenobacter jeollabukensis TaxID=2025313 RepID=A0A5R8WMC2_9BACT|nr:TonB-dependent receptor [Hymenobacter jeollabukensis]TLM90408.1 TonB-dependent receptor [Hymenobacter jeollabukensis]
MKNSLLLLLASAGLLATEAAAQAPATRPAAPASGAPTGAPGGASPQAAILPAAPRGNGRISGTVLDATTKQPVEFATVALLPATGEQPLDGAVADDKGRFSLKGLAPGSYRLSVSFIGCGAVVQPVTLAEGKMSVDLGSVALQSQTKQLGEVQVTGERPVVESKPDRLVYNAAQDATNKGGTAADVLRKAPMVSVDPDGNLQLRGSGNVRVLINGKPSAIVANDVAQALKQLPADQIKNVEVITNPSAKYDSEGSAGIINIVLKENNLQGVNGSVGLAAGTRNSNANFNLNARKGKVGFNSALNGWAFYAPGVQAVDRNTYDRAGKLISTLTQRNEGRGGGGGGNLRLGVDYEPAPNHALNLTLNGNLFRNGNNADVSQTFTPGNDRRSNYDRELEQKFRNQNFDLTGSYTRSFGQQSRREWSVLGQHSRNTNRREYDIDQYELYQEHLSPFYQESSLNRARNVETTLQTDYVHPLSDKQTVEVGAKMILRDVYSNYYVDTAGTRGVFGQNASLTNIFDYTQNVTAGYATYATPLGKKYNVRLGGRVERTDIEGNFQGDAGRFTLGYTNALPNVSLTRNLKQQGSTIRASYTRRIQRPSIFFLNPYVNRIDPFNIQRGNPSLNAEFADNYELNWNTFVKGSVINLTGYARITNNAIEAVRTTRDTLVNGVTRQILTGTYGNVARNQTFGLNAFGSVKPLPKWDVSGNVNVSYVYLKSQALQTSNSGLMYSANINSGYKFDKGLSLQFFGMLNSRRIQLQGTSSAWSMYAIGVRKDLFKGKGDLTLNADNPFTKFRRLENNFRTRYFDDPSLVQSDQRNTTNIYQRGVRLAFNYRFGKLENKPKRPSRSIRNDDQKSGDGGQGGN